MRILIVEPDESVAESLRLMLGSEDFNVYAVASGAEAIEFASLYDYDLMTLELNLPDMSGLDVIRQLRVAKVRTSIIALSSNDRQVVSALNCGADDYMTKPFHKDELVARIHAIVRRAKGHAQSVIETGPLSLNLSTKKVTLHGKPVKLTGKEYGMLEILSLRKGHTLSKEQFLSHLYGGRDEPDLKIIDVFVCKLRQKLTAASGGEHDAHLYIETVWGRGYVLREPNGASPSLAPELRDLCDSTRGGGLAREALLRERINIEHSPPLQPSGTL